MKEEVIFGKETSVQQIFDRSPLAIYVNALDTYELLYCNEPARRLFKVDNSISGAKCYEKMGLSKPCPFCRINCMNYEGNYSREFYHSILKKNFALSGRLINWNGIPAHIEYILDVTEQKQADANMDELKNILKNIPGGLSVYRFDGKNISPIFHNAEFYRIMGYSTEHIFETQEATNNLNVHPDDEKELNQRIFQAIKTQEPMSYTYRVFNDKLGAYRYIKLDGIVKKHEDGSFLLYGLYSDVDEHYRLEQKIADESRRTQNIINSIPGGVAIYCIGKKVETKYISEGLPTLLGYHLEEFDELFKDNAIGTIYEADRPEIISTFKEALDNDADIECECRQKHRDGHFIWVHIHAQKIGDENGFPLIQCVFHDITSLKETKQELDHLVNSIPGGIAVYNFNQGKFGVKYYSDGVAQLTGHTREEYDRLVNFDYLNHFVFAKDCERVKEAIKKSFNGGKAVDISYRRIHKDGHLVWVHLNGKLSGSNPENSVLYAVITGMSAETHLYQSIANETADGIYVIDKSNYDLLYANESVHLFVEQGSLAIGEKCYHALHGLKEPCSFCSFKNEGCEGTVHEMHIPGNNRIYSTRFKETDWNGIPAFIKYVSDITDKYNLKLQKERMEEYFQTLIKILPGGVAVVSYDEKRGTTIPEFLSEGFAAMCGMSQEEAWELYNSDSFNGVHPDDVKSVNDILGSHLAMSEDSVFELTYRLKHKNGSYFWIKNSASLMHDADGSGTIKIYSTYNDINDSVLEKQRMHDLFTEMIVQHHRSKDPNLIIAGHCSLTEKCILQITDHTENNLIATFGLDRDDFFTGFSNLIVDGEAKQEFLSLYLTTPALAAFEEGKTQTELDCLIKLPNEKSARFVHIIVNTVKSPDTGEVIGVLSVLDYTERHISDSILHRLASTNYDFIADIDLKSDEYRLISHDANSAAVPSVLGSYTKQAVRFLEGLVVPKDKAMCREKLDVDYIKQKLSHNDSYVFHYTIADKDGKTYAKSMIVFYIDRLLERVCMARTDISDSVREQRQLLNILAYTFDLACFINVNEGSFVMHTRETVLNHLSPYWFDSYEATSKNFTNNYGTEESHEEVCRQFDLHHLLERLNENPQGYEFTFPFIHEGKQLFKQVNILWGDENHQTICMVRADVTESLNAEQKARDHLKSALAIAQEANRAKTDFLSSMSHDIRTPMNAIIGMTDLAMRDSHNQVQVDESLRVIKASSDHLLHLINDILDMSRIESGKMVLLKEPFNIKHEVDIVKERFVILAKQKNIQFTCHIDVKHDDCIGDAQRIQQIFENLIGNAIKFTPSGGHVTLHVKELYQKSKSIGWYRYEVVDDGIGMDEEAKKRMFEPFYRSQNLQVENVEGTGLGLSIVRSIVDYKGGILSVESELGKGSKFIVDLPLHFAETSEFNHAEEKVMCSSQNDNLGDVRILLVEDHPINQLVARRILENMGAQVELAENGEEGWKKFIASDAHYYHAICMDIRMPIMDGFQATKAIRASNHPDALSIPIIAMTANAFTIDIKQCLDAGMNDHVAKPIDAKKLFSTLNRLINTK